MAQVESTTAKMYAALAKGLKGDVSDTPSHIALDTGDMGSNDEDTNAAVSECAASGLTRAEGTMSLQTTTKTDDTQRTTHQHTAAASATITGSVLMSAISAGNCLAWCAYNASQPLESGDKITNQYDTQMKKD